MDWWMDRQLVDFELQNLCAKRRGVSWHSWEKYTLSSLGNFLLCDYCTDNQSRGLLTLGILFGLHTDGFLENCNSPKRELRCNTSTMSLLLKDVHHEGW